MSHELDTGVKVIRGPHIVKKGASLMLSRPSKVKGIDLNETDFSNFGRSLLVVCQG